MPVVDATELQRWPALCKHLRDAKWVMTTGQVVIAVEDGNAYLDLKQDERLAYGQAEHTHPLKIPKQERPTLGACLRAQAIAQGARARTARPHA